MIAGQTGREACASEAKPQLRGCREHLRRLREDSRRTTEGIHELDRLLHKLWSRLPLRLLRVASTAALIMGAAYLVVANRSSIARALQDLGRAHPSFIALGILEEAVSIGFSVALLAVLLRRSSTAVPLRTLASLTLIGTAMLNSLPGGQAISTVYQYQQLTRRHVDRTSVAIALLVSTLIGIATLPLLAVGGLLVGGSGFPANVRLPLVATAAVVLIGSYVFRRQLFPAVLWVLGRLGLGAKDAATNTDRLPLLFALGLCNWAFDLGALLAALAALGVSVPLSHVVVAYALGQLVSAIPILPGGGGSIEAVMIAGLAVTGGATVTIAAAVVLYRVISAWGLVPIGWILWMLTPNAHQRRLAPAVELAAE